MPKIIFDRVSVIYPFDKKSDIVAINELNLELMSNKIHVFLGESGCGKTTLLKTLYSGVSYEGKITLDDVDIEEFPIKERNIAYVSQNYALYPNMTIFDNIAFPLKNMGAKSDEIRQRVYQIAEELDISMCLSRKPKHISGGQQQRTALARALVKNPNLCLFDEPLSNLDNNSSYMAKELIYESIKKRNITTLYVTHDIKEATSLADFIHVMKDGEIIFNGTVEEFINSNDPRISMMVNEK